MDHRDTFKGASGSGNRELNKKVKEALVAGYNKLKVYYTQTNEIVMLTTALDPRRRLAYFLGREFPPKEVADMKQLMLRLMRTTYDIGIGATTAEPQVSSQAPTSTRHNSFDLFDNFEAEAEACGTETADAELNRYLEEKVVGGKTDILTWWKVCRSVLNLCMLQN
jgi:hypothetical protein